MSDYIHFDEKVRTELVHLFENIKDEYVPNNADDVLIILKIKEAIKNNSLTIANLLELKGSEKYTQIMNVLRMARINFALSRFEDK